MKVLTELELSKEDLEVLKVLKDKVKSGEWDQEKFEREYAFCFPHPDVLKDELSKLKSNYFVVT